MPLAIAMGASLFYDIGIGTGFYSRQMLSSVPGLRGVGYDISPHSIAFAQAPHLGLGPRPRDARFAGRMIVAMPVDTPAPCVISVEVLEHLEDPLTFLKALAGMLSAGGVGFITAALTAPNADHIYLYSDVSEVISQLDEAGLRT